MNPSRLEQMVSLRRAAALLDVGQSTMRRWARRFLPLVRVGGPRGRATIRVRVSDLQAFIDQRTAEAPGKGNTGGETRG